MGTIGECDQDLALQALMKSVLQKAFSFQYFEFKKLLIKDPPVVFYMEGLIEMIKNYSRIFAGARLWREPIVPLVF